MRFLLLMCFLLTAFTCSSQDIERELQEYFDAVRQNPAARFDQSTLMDLSKHKPAAIVLKKYVADQNPEVSFRAMDLLTSICAAAPKKDLRAIGVQTLVVTMADKNLRKSAFASQKLLSFKPEDFSMVDQDSILHYIKPGTPNLDILLMIAGTFGPGKSLDHIQNFLILPGSKKIKLSARFALARMGDERAINYLLEEIPQMPVDDAFVSGVVPGLVYTREKNIFALLDQIVLNSDGECNSLTSPGKKVPCAYEVLRAMAQVIEKFPIKFDAKVNPESTLAQGRQWLKENPAYKIIRQGF